MNILLSNDDGFMASGLMALYHCLSQQFKVMVIAPDKDRSGASNSLTLESPLRLTKQNNHFYSVNGTPTDCIHLALTGLYDNPPDLVISGINAGANMGDDVIYSGTVAAAMEGRNLGLPAIAVSIDSFEPKYFSTATKAIVVLLRQMSYFNENSASIFNINVPDIPWDEIKGFQVTRLGKRHKAEAVIKSKDPRGHTIYWVGPPGKQQDAGEGTDFYAVDQGYISITPLQIDLTHYKAIAATKEWLKNV